MIIKQDLGEEALMEGVRTSLERLQKNSKTGNTA